MIAVVEGCGTNVASLLYALKRIGKKAVVTDDPALIQTASHVILPGVSSAKRAMQSLKDKNLLDVIRGLCQPVLGICSGMQILFSHSEEGNVQTLNIIPGEINKLLAPENGVLPHMGWNTLEIPAASSLFKGIPNKSYVYFVHSYGVQCIKETIATVCYGERFSAAVKYQNFYGVQFHPEKSGIIGERILENFLLGAYDELYSSN